ncbi:phosphomethylpyrimidine synthase ThiC [Azotobacter beijerinckii]|uniref:phosphomethylpyrimidine synthase ThiC n=1 Tax=Azotobacter beijerinckii TaxID=170623 RepID=UPI0029531DD0|nr:phosphomethylpyrimidine synthase ThiC [Azotobacter beijerinckii]MDV7212496.1 phosphomethylpyrimidine synthase ThiC [Azotobacter beijerinckii]
MTTKHAVEIRTGSGSLSAGEGFRTLIMALVGASHPRQFEEQARKIQALFSCSAHPEIISDLSIVRSANEPPLWRRVINETCAAAATLPVYSVKPSADGRIAPSELLDIAIEQMEAGVGLMTIHPTPCKQINDLALTRLVTFTSRGGGLIINDAKRREWKGDNIYLQILPELIKHAKRNGTVLSLGASYRSANIFDSCDAAQTKEIEVQTQLACEISRHGVGVIIESPGHARPRDIKKVAALLRPSGFPVMPLGPIPTDTAVGQDHISSAIGATLMGLERCAHILAAVTREEHTGGIPSVESTLEAVAAAKVAAHIIDLELLGEDKLDREIALARSQARTCLSMKKSHGCDRCARACPL